MSWRHDAGRSGPRRACWQRNAVALAATTVFASIGTRAEELVLELVVEGRAAAVDRVLVRDGVPYATLATWRRWGLRLPPAFATAGAILTMRRGSKGRGIK